METTGKNKTTNTLVEYYKANVDVHIAYLLLLNTSRKISNIGYLDLAPILESIRTEMYERVENLKTNSETASINLEIKEELASILEHMGLKEVNKYIGYKLPEKTIIDLTVAVMMRRCTAELSSIDANTNASVVAESIIGDLRNLIPAGDIREVDLTSYEKQGFLSSIQIHRDENATIIKYIDTVLTSFERLIAMFNHDSYELIPTDKIEYLKSCMDDTLNITNASYLAEVIDIIKEEIAKRTKKAKTLEKFHK